MKSTASRGNLLKNDQHRDGRPSGHAAQVLFLKVNPDGTDAPVKVKLLKNVRPAPAAVINWESDGTVEALKAGDHSVIKQYRVESYHGIRGDGSSKFFKVLNAKKALERHCVTNKNG